jgi:hypothetical protein
VELFPSISFTACDVRRSRFMGPAQGCVLELQICTTVFMAAISIRFLELLILLDPYLAL